jgi:hypothetical protein
MFPIEKLNECIASCDERIASVQSKLDNWKPYAGVMGLMAEIYDKDEDKKVFTESPQLDNVKNYENDIKLIKVEKMMWNAFKNNGKKEIFKHILAKYGELMIVSYDISGNMVMNGIAPEGEYLDYCKQSLEQREFIRKMCCVGYRGHLE